MKYFISSFLFFLAVNVYSQESQFTITKDNLTDYMVVNCKGKTEKELYDKTLEWISLNFKNPGQVIQAQLVNQMIRIEGDSEKFNGFSNSKYVIEISFKEGKYKFDPTQYTIINGINKFDFFATYQSYFNKEGEVKDRLKVTVNGVLDTMNGLNKSLEKFILNHNSDSNKW